MRLRTLIPLLTLASLAIFMLAIDCGPGEIHGATPQGPNWAPLEPLPASVGSLNFSGRVLAPTGEAVPNALVLLDDDGRIVWAHSDELGHFELPGLLGGLRDVHLLALGYPPVVIEMELGASPVELRLPALLPPPPVVPVGERSRLTGLVRRQMQKLSVSVEPLTPAYEFGLAVPRWARVNKDGTFEFEELAHGEYRVRLIPRWAEGGTWPDLLTALDGSNPIILRHAASGPTREKLALTPRCGELKGHVGRRTSQSPGNQEPSDVAGALILVSPAHEDGDKRRFWRPVETDSSGEFHFEQLPPGQYRVVLQAGPCRKETLIDIVERGLATWYPTAEY